MIIPSNILHGHGHDGRFIVVATTSRAVHEISGAAAAAAKSAVAPPLRRVPRLMARYLGPGSLLASRETQKTDAECHPQPNVDLCEKQAAAGHMDVIVPVTIVAVILICLFAVLFYLHMRRQKRDEAEWSSKNNHEMEDYGIEPAAPSKVHSRR